MKLKDVKGLLGEKMYDPTKVQQPDYPDDYRRGNVRGYNQAREEDENREIELDMGLNESKIKEAIEVVDIELYTLNAYLENEEFIFHHGRFKKMIKALYTFKNLAEAIAKADIIKVKEAKAK